MSAPSVFIQLKNLLVSPILVDWVWQATWLTPSKTGWAEDKRPKLHLLEFDERFSVFPEFSFYDFNNPLKLPREFASTLVIEAFANRW